MARCIHFLRGYHGGMSGIQASLMRGLLLMLMLCALARGQAPEVSGVTVHFSDGSQEHLERKSAPATQPAIPKKSLMGVNVEGLRDYSRSMMLIDAMKTSRLFASPNKPWSGTVPLDANGWPTSDAGVVVMTESINAGGVYRFSCTGPAVVKAVASPADVKNL